MIFEYDMLYVCDKPSNNSDNIFMIYCPVLLIEKNCNIVTMDVAILNGRRSFSACDQFANLQRLIIL